MISFQLFCESDYHHAFVMAPSAVLGLNNTPNLPPDQPYGFWVNKWGHWVAVKPYGHSEKASEILEKYKDHSGVDISGGGYYTTLYRHGFIRLVSLYNGSINWQNSSRDFTPTQSQQKFLNQLSTVYGVSVSRDSSNVEGH